MGFGIHQVRLCGQLRQQGLEVSMRARIQTRRQPATGHAQPRPSGHPAMRQAASEQHLMQQHSILHAPILSEYMPASIRSGSLSNMHRSLEFMI